MNNIIKDVPIGILLAVVSVYVIWFSLYLSGYPGIVAWFVLGATFYLIPIIVFISYKLIVGFEAHNE
jgi:hypothetical protein